MVRLAPLQRLRGAPRRAHQTARVSGMTTMTTTRALKENRSVSA
jgi:hypothetical protein